VALRRYFYGDNACFSFCWISFDYACILSLSGMECGILEELGMIERQYDPFDIEAAHKHSIRHREEVLASKLCCCFHCLAGFPPSEIKEWTDQQWHTLGATALCPQCGKDAVLGDASGLQFTDAFIIAMNQHWFD
jgi:hypothetical protein